MEGYGSHHGLFEDIPGFSFRDKKKQKNHAEQLVHHPSS